MHTLEEQAAALELQRGEREEKRRDMEQDARADIMGHEFSYREAMLLRLLDARRERNALAGCHTPQSEVAMIQSVTVTLWGEYARANTLDLRMITRQQYELVAKARTAPIRLRDVQRTMQGGEQVSIPEKAHIHHPRRQ